MQKYHNFSTKSEIAYYTFPDLVEKLGWFEQAPFQNLTFQIWKFTNFGNFKCPFSKNNMLNVVSDGRFFDWDVIVFALFCPPFHLNKMEVGIVLIEFK